MKKALTFWRNRGAASVRLSWGEGRRVWLGLAYLAGVKRGRGLGERKKERGGGGDNETSTQGRFCVRRFQWKEGFVGFAQSRGLTNLLQVDLILYLPFFFLFPLFSISPPLFAPATQARWVWVTYIPNLNVIILDSPCACRYSTVVFALVFLIVPVSIHFQCVVCRYFIRLYMLLFQRRSLVGNSTLMCPYWWENETKIINWRHFFIACIKYVA